MDNRPEKMTEQAKFLEIQMNASKKAKPFDIMTAATMLAVIYIFTALMFIMPDNQFSEQENRVLQQFPALSSNIERNRRFDRLIDGSFTADISEYYADQFPMRDYLIGIKGIAEIGLLKRENNGVVLTKGDYLIIRENKTNFDMLTENINSAAQFADAMRKMDTPFNIAVAGRTYDALKTYLPPNLQNDKSDYIWSYIKALQDVSPQLRYINLLQPLQNRIINQNEHLYYRTDHHWTTLGAYYAYAEIMKNFKEEPQPLSFFKRETATDSFYGTTWSKAGMKWIKPDKIEYFRYDGDMDYITEIVDTGRTFDGFYDISYLEVKDKYSSFIGGNNARVNITKKNIENGETRPKMLIMKDSFAHSVIPFFAYHYDLVILDMRFFPESVARLVFNENIQRVLILNNVENLMNSNLYGILNYGLETAVENYIKSQFPIKNIYINGNSIKDYRIVCPDIREYIESAEQIASIILTRTGYELEIVISDDFISFDKAFILSNENLPIRGLIDIVVENNNLVFRCTTKDGITEVVKIFISNYIKNATGSFNFGADFRYSDITDDMIMIMPR